MQVLINGQVIKSSQTPIAIKFEMSELVELIDAARNNSDIMVYFPKDSMNQQQIVEFIAPLKLKNQIKDRGPADLSKTQPPNNGSSPAIVPPANLNVVPAPNPDSAE